MKLLADEGVESQIVDALRSGGHDVEYVADLAPGIKDEEVLRRANEDERLLMTVDKDFGELVFRLRRAALGVILIRLAGLAPDEKAEIVSRSLEQHSAQIQGAFTVISLGLVRIRPSM